MSLAPNPPPFDQEELLVTLLLSVSAFPDDHLMVVSIDGGSRTFFTPIPHRVPASVAAAALPDEPQVRVLVTFGGSMSEGIDRSSAVRALLDDPDSYAFHVTREEWVNLDDGSHGSYEDLRSHPVALDAAFSSGKILP